MRKKIIFPLGLLVLLIAGCCKSNNEDVCNTNTFHVLPIFEKYGRFTCGGNTYEYEYVKRSKGQIDSLFDCNFSPPVPFPTDETDLLYVMVGKIAYHYRDTFQTTLLKDTCNKKLVYQVDMIQQDTAFSTFPGVVSIFSEVENIPADYTVEVKYKYVPIQ